MVKQVMINGFWRQACSACLYGLLLVGLSLPALAEQRVLVVAWRGMTPAEVGFIDYLERSGLDVGIDVIDVARDRDQVPAVLERIDRDDVDLVYTFGTSLTLALAGSHDAPVLESVPIVFNIVADPVGAGVVRDLMSSGRNVTGASHLVPLDVQYRALQSVGPFARIGVPFNQAEANSGLAVQALRDLAAQEGHVLIEAPIDMEEAASVEARIDAAMSQLLAAEVGLIYLPSDSLLIANAEQVVSMAQSAGIPVFSATEAPIRQAGALFGLVSNYYTVGQLAGFKAWQILAENKSPASIPVETLSRFSFLINGSSMRSLALYPPVTVLEFAEVID